MVFKNSCLLDSVTFWSQVSNNAGSVLWQLSGLPSCCREQCWGPGGVSCGKGSTLAAVPPVRIHSFPAGTLDLLLVGFLCAGHFCFQQ